MVIVILKTVLVQQEYYLFKINYLIHSKPRFVPIVVSHGTILMGVQENSACIKVESQQMFHIAFFFFRLLLNKRLKIFISSVSWQFQSAQLSYRDILNISFVN